MPLLARDANAVTGTEQGQMPLASRATCFLYKENNL